MNCIESIDLNVLFGHGRYSCAFFVFASSILHILIRAFWLELSVTGHLHPLSNLRFSMTILLQGLSRHRILLQSIQICFEAVSNNSALSSLINTSSVLVYFSLQSLLSVLRESHRTRTVFRKVGGFVYVMSVLVSMEGCLAEPPKSPWNAGQ